MNTYKDPQYRGYYLGKVVAALLVLLILVVAVAAARNRGLLPAPAAAPPLAAVETASPSPEGAATVAGGGEPSSTDAVRMGAEITTSPPGESSETVAIVTAGVAETAQAPAAGEVTAAGTAASTVGSSEPAAAATAGQGSKPAATGAPGSEPAATATAASGAVQAPATGAVEKDVAVSGTVHGATSAASTSSLSASSTTMGSPSGYRTYTAPGSHMTAVIYINAPARFEISTDAATPIITVSTSSLSAFSTTVGTPSTAQTYTVSGSDLAANISINAPAGFEISKDGSTYSSSLTLTQSGGTVATTTIYVRLTGAAEGSYGGNITHTSTGALSTAAPGTGPAATAAPGTGPAATATALPGAGATAVPAPVATPAAVAGNPTAAATPSTPGSAAAASPTTVAAATATAGPSAVVPELSIRYFVVGKTGEVTLVGAGRPGAPIEVVQGGAVIGTIEVRGDGTWSFTYAAAPGSQVVAVQYQGRPGTRSNPVTFESTGTTSGAATPAATAAARSATPTSAVPAGAGQAYIVQPGDFLRLLAFRFYGDEAQWPVIYNGTNAKAARDASFAVISDPNVIIVGWKLWIPAQ